MNPLNSAGLSVLFVAAMLTLGVNSASATTLEVGGSAKNEAVTVHFTLGAGVSTVWVDTNGFSANTCTGTSMNSTTSSPFTGSSVTGSVSTLTFSGCTRAITVHKPGKLEFTSTSGTNGTVASEEAEVTVGSPVGTLNCKSGATTPLGTVTGVASGNATFHVNAVTNCGIIPSYKLVGTLTATVSIGFHIP